MKASVKRDLDTILRAVERLEREFGVDDATRSGLEGDDEEMRLWLGGIRVNAEDARGALEEEARQAAFKAAFAGGFRISTE